MNTHKHTDVTKKEQAAIEILNSTGIDIIEAALIAKTALAAGRGQIQRTMKCIHTGAEELKRQENTVTFKKAVEAALAARKDCQNRTKQDFRYITTRFLKRCKNLAERKMRSLKSEECARYLEEAFDTPCQKVKARRILSGVFSTAIKRGWCDENPIKNVDIPKLREKTIEILSTSEIEQLLHSAKEYHNGKCLAAVGMMMYAGIRPNEVSRLNWEDIDLENKSICILPQHSKTGGARMVTIYPSLEKLLSSCKAVGQICPTQWLKHWRNLRKQAGFQHWQPDVLRHTYASYHLKHFRNYAELQYETGHRDSNLLRTRYVNLKGVHNEADFWR